MGITNMEVLEKHFFETEMRPVFYQTPGGDFIQTDRVQQVWNKRDQSPVAYVGPGYVPVPYQRLIEQVDRHLTSIGVNAEIRQHSGAKNLAKLQFKLSFPEIDFVPPDGYSIRYEQSFRTSLDGSMDLGFTHSALRLVCLNGMVFSQSMGSYRTRHVGAVVDRLDQVYDQMTSGIRQGSGLMSEELMPMTSQPAPNSLRLVKDALLRWHRDESFRDRVDGLRADTKAASSDVTLWGEKRLVAAEIVRQAAEKASVAVKYSDAMVQQLLDPAERCETVWDVYNVVTNVLSHQPSSYSVTESGLSRMHYHFRAITKTQKDRVLELVN